MLLENKEHSKSPARCKSNYLTSDTGNVKVASGMDVTIGTEREPKFVIPKSRITFEHKANRQFDTSFNLSPMRQGSDEV